MVVRTICHLDIFSFSLFNWLVVAEKQSPSCSFAFCFSQFKFFFLTSKVLAHWWRSQYLWLTLSSVPLITSLKSWSPHSPGWKPIPSNTWYLFREWHQLIKSEGQTPGQTALLWQGWKESHSTRVAEMFSHSDCHCDLRDGKIFTTLQQGHPTHS